MKKLGFLLFMSSGIAYGMGEAKLALMEKYAERERNRSVSYDSFLRERNRQSNQSQTDKNLKANGYSSVDSKKCGSGKPTRRKNKQSNE